jgi:VanZ family protein
MNMSFSGSSRLQLVLHWIPALLGVAMIAVESTSTMSAENTSRWLYPWWTSLFGSISAEHWDELHHLIRKTGHFVGYGVVSMTFFIGWRHTLRQIAGNRPWTLWRRAAVLAVSCTLVVATLDEFHQSFLPDRTSSSIDVCIDVCGAIVAQLLGRALFQLTTRLRPRNI